MAIKKFGLHFWSVSNWFIFASKINLFETDQKCRPKSIFLSPSISTKSPSGTKPTYDKSVIKKLIEKNKYFNCKPRHHGELLPWPSTLNPRIRLKFENCSSPFYFCCRRSGGVVTRPNSPLRLVCSTWLLPCRCDLRWCQLRRLFNCGGLDGAILGVLVGCVTA